MRTLLLLIILISVFVAAEEYEKPKTEYTLIIKDLQTKQQIDTKAIVKIYDVEGKFMFVTEAKNGVVMLEEMSQGKYIAVVNAQKYEPKKIEFSVVPAAAVPMETKIYLSQPTFEEEKLKKELEQKEELTEPEELEEELQEEIEELGDEVDDFDDEEFEEEDERYQACYVPVSTALKTAVKLNPDGICMGGQLGTLIVPPAFVNNDNKPIIDLKPKGEFSTIKSVLTCKIPCEVKVKKTCLKDFGVSHLGANYEENLVDRRRCGDTIEPPIKTPALPQPPQFMPPQLKQSCTGCEQDNKCLPYGTRITQKSEQNYCDINGALKLQKPLQEKCDNNYECNSNACSNGACTDIQEKIEKLEKELEEQKTILRKILDFFKGWFG